MTSVIDTVFENNRICLILNLFLTTVKSVLTTMKTVLTTVKTYLTTVKTVLTIMKSVLTTIKTDLKNETFWSIFSTIVHPLIVLKGFRLYHQIKS